MAEWPDLGLVLKAPPVTSVATAGPGIFWKSAPDRFLAHDLQGISVKITRAVLRIYLRHVLFSFMFSQVFSLAFSLVLSSVLSSARSSAVFCTLSLVFSLAFSLGLSGHSGLYSALSGALSCALFSTPSLSGALSNPWLFSCARNVLRVCSENNGAWNGSLCTFARIISDHILAKVILVHVTW